MSQGFLQDLLAIFANPYVAVIFVIALGFDFINGFHDAANSIATIVGTRVLRPGPAVLWAAFFNFVAAWVFGVAIANTVAKMVQPAYVTPDVILSGLVGAIVWDLLTWWVGLPTSSSHALLGGFGGAAMAYAGTWVGVLHAGKFMMTVEFIVIAPLIGFALALLFAVIVLNAFQKLSFSRVDRYFRVIQFGSAAAFSLGHGTNDAQKTMGIIAALLYSTIWKGQQGLFEGGRIAFPFWIVLVCHLAMGLGTLTGGWRIVKTMGMKLTKLRPWAGACAETAAALSLFVSEHLGVPVSTTHTIAGGIIGVGAVQRVSAVRWGIARQVVWAWVLTIPAAGLVGAICFYALSIFR